MCVSRGFASIVGCLGKSQMDQAWLMHLRMSFWKKGGEDDVFIKLSLEEDDEFVLSPE